MTPYTYLIGWKVLNRWYYGVRYARDCHPSDLWTTYFTSSRYVRQMRDDYGDPDVVEVRQVFNDQLQARKWEHKVLRRMRVVKNSNWLNKTDNKSIDPGCAGSAHRGLTYIQKYGEEKSDKLKQAIAKANQTRERVPWKEKYPGIPFRKTKTPAWNRGVPRTEEEKRKIGGQRAKMKKESIEKMALTKIGRHWYVNTKTGKTSCLFDTDVSDDWKRGRKL